MRRHDQLSLDRPWIVHPHAQELETISRILDSHPAIAEAVAQDLLRGVKNPHTGARGMSGDQVLRVLVVKQMNGFSFEALAFHLVDSATYRTFCRFGALEEVPKKSTLAENLKKLTPSTLEALNRLLLERAKAEGVEKGRKVRIDATVVESDIHAPTDSSLLYDGIRLLSRLLSEAEEICGFRDWSDHTRRAKRRHLAIQHAKKVEGRQVAYRDLLQVARASVGYARRALPALRTEAQASRARPLARRLRRARKLVQRVIRQTERRVLHGESVPAAEKVVSLFEPHTDVIVKDRRDTLYGHKVLLSGGASGLILDCVVETGNPADATRAIPMLQRQQEIYGRPPRQASFDGGFASKENLRAAKALGVKDVCFSKKRGLQIHEMVKSTWVYRRLRDFRAGIEGQISCLKRVFGLARCTWRGELSFHSYVWASVLSANLLTLARHLLG